LGLVGVGVGVSSLDVSSSSETGAVGFAASMRARCSSPPSDATSTCSAAPP